MAYTIWGGPIESYETSFPFPMKHKKTRPYYKPDGQTDQQWNVTPLIWAFGGQQFIVAYCGSPFPLPARVFSLFLIILHLFWST